MRMLASVIIVLLLCCGCQTANRTPSASSKDLHGKTLQSAQNQFVVTYTTQPDPIPLNVPFSIDVVVQSAEGGSTVSQDVSLAVDGRMPHHRHGMNRQPTVTAKGAGQFHVDNMLFHMPGRWELYFDIVRDGRTERAQDVIFLD